MKQPTKHHLVDSAARYAGTRFQTLNVSSALWRAEALVLDAEEMLELKKAAEDKDITFGSRLSTYGIISGSRLSTYYLSRMARSITLDRPNALQAVLHHR